MDTLPIPTGFCQCGCGQQTAIAKFTRRSAFIFKGKPYRFMRGHKPISLRERFWEKVNKTADCWLWTGAINSDGYGHIGHNKTVASAHRVSWELHRGPIPTGMLVLHTCDTPACVSPSHLFLGTNTDNARDKMRKGRWRAHGQRGSAIGNSKLKESDIPTIRQLVKDGISQRAVARSYGVTHEAVRKILRGETWSHIV